MRAKYLLSVIDSHNAIYSAETGFEKKAVSLKRHEVVTLRKMCNIFLEAKIGLEILDGYYVGYTIPQISNEFDLLRFGKDKIINIELKGHLSNEVKINVIKKQMEKQYYYLKFLGKTVYVFTYVEDDGFYLYNPDAKMVCEVDISFLIEMLKSQEFEVDIDLSRLFKPANYLVSPFNKVDKFINNEYFLTPDQEKKKKEILKDIESGNYKYFCISANAGTGKTLLTYDIAKTYQLSGKNVVIIHCAILNSGQMTLCAHHRWNIHPASDLQASDIEEKLGSPDLIVIDEAHRIWKKHLEYILNFSAEHHTPVLFSYDIKQFLKAGENTDIYSYLNGCFPESTAPLKTLTTRIRTNKMMASFIHNMYEIGSSNDNLDYSGITIEYFDQKTDAKAYMDYLAKDGSWKFITYTASRFSREPIDSLAPLSEDKAHGVIGQEFERVVFPMDSNFLYNEKKRLVAKRNYYSLSGMLYQIVTRAVSELKIVVIDNPELYKTLLKIKHMGDND